MDRWYMNHAIMIHDDDKESILMITFSDALPPLSALRHNTSVSNRMRLPQKSSSFKGESLHRWRCEGPLL